MASASASTMQSPAQMVDDTLGPINPVLEEAIKLELADIAQFKTNRLQRYNWATHELKMLVSDEEDDGEEQLRDYDPDDPEDIERYAIAMSLGEEGYFQRKSNPPNSPIGSSSLDEEVTSCPQCNIYPRFSRNKKTRKFRLVQPWEYSKPVDSLRTCDHFLAVSYCWAGNANPTRTCQIRDCTGPRKHQTPQQNISAKGKSKDEGVYLEGARVPPDEVLDRAVEFASHEGLRCIWIDRCCLPQDESREQQIGIQSMELVYQRATRTCGLLETTITSQEVLRWLSLLFAWTESGATFGETPGQDFWNLHCQPSDVADGWAFGVLDIQVPEDTQKRLAARVCCILLDFLEDLAKDRWYTRAWILQESISAGRKFKLLFRVLPGLTYVYSPFVQQHGKLLNSEGGSQTFVLTLEEFLFLVDGLKQMVHEFFDKQRESRWTGRPHDLSLVDTLILAKAKHALAPDRIQRLHPVHERRGDITYSWNSHYTCNAASAIALLRTRHCLKPEDKTAIVADLCGYETRLDTFKLGKRFRSLRICLLALAMLNGDLSLLAPENYDLEPSMMAIGAPKLKLLEFPIRYIHELNKLDVEPDSTPRFQFVNTQFLQPRGAYLPAYLWRVDREIDFTPIRERWADTWWGMKGLSMKFPRLPDESPEDYLTRGRMFRDLMGRSDESEFSRIIAESRKLKEYEIGQVYQDDAYPGVQFSTRLSGLAAKNNPKTKEILGSIVADILTYLYHANEKEVATSIWQSFRRTMLRETDLNNGLLPDEVDSDLLAHPVFLNEPCRLVHLDAIPGSDGMAGEWILDRILIRGKLWVGNYVPSNMGGSALAIASSFKACSNDIEGPTRLYQDLVHKSPFAAAMLNSQMKCTLIEIRMWLENFEKGSMERGLLETWATEPLSFKNSSIIGRDMVKAYLVHRMTLQWRSPEISAKFDPTTKGQPVHKFDPTDKGQPQVTIHQLMEQFKDRALIGMSVTDSAMLTYMDTYVGWDIEQQDARCASRVSAFDVDGPCLVATPYDAKRERFPQTVERSMATCWVVKKLGMSVDELEAAWMRGEHVRHSNVIFGLDSLLPRDEISDTELKHVPADAVKRMTVLKLEVLGVVKGVWEIIDPVPFQTFQFS